MPLPPASPKEANRELACVVAAQRLVEDSIVSSALEAFPGPAFVLNSCGEIVRANSKCSKLPAGKPSVVRLNSGEDQWRVRYDGQGRETVRELIACAAPVSCASGPIVLVAVQEASAGFIRDRVLETLEILTGLTEISDDWDPAALSQVHREADLLATELLQELACERCVNNFQADVLEPQLGEFPVGALLTDLAAAAIERFPETSIAVPPIGGRRTVFSDALMLRQVLRALLENAAEASASDRAVTLGFEHVSQPTFTVHSWTSIPPSAQLRIFQRGFSTKPRSAAGMGCYLARLLTEQYLRGRIGFTSSREAGTRFYVELPGGKKWCAREDLNLHEN